MGAKREPKFSLHRLNLPTATILQSTSQIWFISPDPWKNDLFHRRSLILPRITLQTIWTVRHCFSQITPYECRCPASILRKTCLQAGFERYLQVPARRKQEQDNWSETLLCSTFTSSRRSLMQEPTGKICSITKGSGALESKHSCRCRNWIGRMPNTASRRDILLNWANWQEVETRCTLPSRRET